MKRIVISLATLALAASLAAPLFGATAPKGQTQGQTMSSKTPAKHHTNKKSTKGTHKASTTSAKSTSK